MATKLFNPALFGFPQFNTGEVAVPKTRLFNINLFGFPQFNTGETLGPKYHVTKSFVLALDKTWEADLER